MQRQRRRDTAPELALRSILHRRGFRFFVDRVVVSSRRRADLVFPRARVAVFVDGCFWHGCPRHATWPKQNADWWRSKIEGNRKRDRDTDGQLREIGWLPVRVWEHEPAGDAANRIAAVVVERVAALVSEQET